MPSWLTSPQAVRLFGQPLLRIKGQRANGREPKLSNVKRVLVVRLDEIGDVVMTTPFLRELRRNLPHAWITLVVKPAVYNLVELCPYVNEVLTYDWNTRGSLSHLRLHMRALVLAWKHLWRGRFDLAVLPRWDEDRYNGTFLAFFSGATWRVGYSENVIENKRQFNTGYDQLLTHVLDDKTPKHEVVRNLDVIRHLGGTIKEDKLELWLNSEDELFAEHFLSLQGVSRNDLLTVFGPGKRDLKRRWPLSRFIELGAWLKEKYKARILVVGEEEEEILGAELQQQLGDIVINMVGRTNLRQTVALLKHCHLYVGNDYGPKHMAAAVGVPVIEINGHPQGASTLHHHSPSRFGPWCVPHRVVQPKISLSRCSDAGIDGRAHCITGVSLQEVKDAVVAQLPLRDDRIVSKRVSTPAVDWHRKKAGVRA
jgi:ADP-heptose:LPS heptosyltransferase